ncbi:hypothetical protein WA158_001056 [Blastocystis sp. Blastoise]
MEGQTEIISNQVTDNQDTSIAKVDINVNNELKIVSESQKMNDTEVKSTTPETSVKTQQPTTERKPSGEEDKEIVSISVPSQESGLTSTQFIINLMKGIAGTGSLAVPYACSQMGIILSVVLYVVIALSYLYGGNTLLKFKKVLNSQLDNKENSKLKVDSDFVKIVTVLMGNFGYYLILFTILVTLWGSSIGTMVVSTDFAANLPYDRIGITADPLVIRIVCCVVITIIAGILVTFKNTDPLVYVSSFGLFALIASFIILFIRGGIDYGLTFTQQNLYPQSATALLSQLGVFVYSLGYVFFLFPLYKSMRPSHQKKSSRNILITLLLMTIIYLGTGLPLFLMFQNDPNGLQSNILNNLNKNSVENIIICIAMIISCIGGYPLLFMGILEITEANFKNLKTMGPFVSDFNRVFFRWLQVIIISVISICVPFFGSVLTQVLPALLNIIYNHKSKTPENIWMRLFHWCFFIVFVVVMIICTYISGVSLVEDIKKTFNI